MYFQDIVNSALKKYIPPPLLYILFLPKVLSCVPCAEDDGFFNFDHEKNHPNKKSCSGHGKKTPCNQDPNRFSVFSHDRYGESEKL